MALNAPPRSRRSTPLRLLHLLLALGIFSLDASTFSTVLGISNLGRIPCLRLRLSPCTCLSFYNLSRTIIQQLLHIDPLRTSSTFTLRFSKFSLVSSSSEIVCSFTCFGHRNLHVSSELRHHGFPLLFPLHALTLYSESFPLCSSAVVRVESCPNFYSIESHHAPHDRGRVRVRVPRQRTVHFCVCLSIPAVWVHLVAVETAAGDVPRAAVATAASAVSACVGAPPSTASVAPPANRTLAG